jgi:hypothetical protein
MLIEKVSILTGKKNVMDIDITEKRYFQWLKEKTIIQYAFPELSPEEREFLISGITPEEWANHFDSDEIEDLL